MQLSIFYRVRFQPSRKFTNLRCPWWVLRSDAVERRLPERHYLSGMESQKVGVYVNKVLEQYGLPNTIHLLGADYSKAQWKSH